MDKRIAFIGVVLVVWGSLNAPNVAGKQAFFDGLDYTIECDNEVYVTDISGYFDAYCDVTNKKTSSVNDKLQFLADEVYNSGGIPEDIQISDIYQHDGIEWVSFKNFLKKEKLGKETKLKFNKNFHLDSEETIRFKIRFKTPFGSDGKFDVQFGNDVLDPWWNASWNQRQNFTISSAFSENDYVLKLILTPDIADFYNINNDCSDLIFAVNEDEIIKHYNDFCDRAGGLIIQNFKMNVTTGLENITMYFDNPNAVSTSDGFNTLLIFDNWTSDITEQWDEIDPNSHITIDRVTDERLEFNGLERDEDAYVYMNISLDFPTIREFTFIESSNLNCPGAFAMTGDEIDDSWNLNNGSRMTWDFNNAVAQSNLNGIRSYGSAISSNTNTTYYVRIEDFDDEINVSLWTDAGRTVLFGFSNYTYSDKPTNIDHFFALASQNQLSSCGGGLIGWIDDVKVRKVTFPEPTISPHGTITYEEFIGVPPVAVNVTIQGEFDFDVPITLASCVDNNTLEVKTDTYLCTGEACSWFNKTQFIYCANGCYQDISEQGAGCSPTQFNVLIYTMVILFAFIGLVIILMGTRKRRRGR